MDTILEQCKGVISIADNIITHGETEEIPDQNLLQLMHIAKDNGLVFNSTKCDSNLESDHQHIFEHLKTIVSTETTLKYYDPKAPVQVQVDASQKGLRPSHLQPSKDEQGWYARNANIEREMLAVCFGIRRFHTYLFGRDFTDHKPLEMISLKALAASPPRLKGMLLEIQGYNYRIVIQLVSNIWLADPLSRLPNPENKEEIDWGVKMELIQFEKTKLEEIQQNIENYPILWELVEIISHGWPEKKIDLPTCIRQYWSYRDELSVENWIIPKGTRVFIPEPLHNGILKDLDTGPMGIVKTKLRARHDVYWPNINEHIEKLCQSCDVCNEAKNSQTRENIIPYETPSTAWQIVGTDLFDLEKEQYLIIADYWVTFIICFWRRQNFHNWPNYCLNKTLKHVFMSPTGYDIRM